MGKEELASLLRAVMTDYGWSQRRLSRECGVPLGTVNNLYHARVEEPDGDTLQKLADGTQIDLAVWERAVGRRLTVDAPDPYAATRARGAKELERIFALRVELAKRPGALTDLEKYAEFLVQSRQPDTTPESPPSPGPCE